MPTNNYSDNSFDDQAPLDDEQLWDLLSLYVDGEADPEQATIVEQMLSSDPAYRRDFDFLMASSKTMHMVEEVEPPASLRETVLSKTSHRPTLVGRVRAAWARVTTPAFGRYATVGGAFAAAAIGAVIFWPHQTSPSGTESRTPLVVITHPPQSTEVVEGPHTIPLPPFTLTPITPGKSTDPRPPVHLQENAPLSPKLNAKANLPKATKVNDKPVVTVSPPHTTNISPRIPTLDGAGKPEFAYSYNPKMDSGAARQTMGTIVASNLKDVGPKLTTYEEAPTPPHAENDPSQKDPIVANAGNVGPVPSPTSRIHTATLPPSAKQVLAESTLRKDPSMRLDNSDRPSTDSGQRRDVMQIAKLNF